MGLNHNTGSLFDSPPNSILVHSGNAQGTWGAGVARVMRARFPRAAQEYQEACNTHGQALLGTFVFTHEKGYGIATLVVSRGYGRRKDDAETILAATTSALSNLLAMHPRSVFHSPRINAGLFAVPWERTEAVLRNLVERHRASWTVWTLHPTRETTP